MPDPRPASLAVLIDGDNTSPRYAQAIFEEIAKLGEANVRRIYGDFSGGRLKGWDEAVRTFAILQHQQRENSTGKNASDIALVIDAMDLMHKDKFDGFCLVSSDSDFTRLAQRLREDGLEVFGFGERKAVKAFINACNQFIYVENLLAGDSAESDNVAKPTASGSKPASTSANAAQAGADKSEEARPTLPSTKAVPLLLQAMKQMEDDGGWYNLGALGSVLRKLHPDFDPRTYGCTKLSDLAAKTGHFQTKEVKGSGPLIALKPRKNAK